MRGEAVDLLPSLPEKDYERILERHPDSCRRRLSGRRGMFFFVAFKRERSVVVDR